LKLMTTSAYFQLEAFLFEIDLNRVPFISHRD
jgi:hypothetical protein